MSIINTHEITTVSNNRIALLIGDPTCTGGIMIVWELTTELRAGDRIVSADGTTQATIMYANESPSYPDLLIKVDRYLEDSHSTDWYNIESILPLRPLERLTDEDGKPYDRLVYTWVDGDEDGHYTVECDGSAPNKTIYHLYL